jgi:hypothetical protein
LPVFIVVKVERFAEAESEHFEVWVGYGSACVTLSLFSHSCERRCLKPEGESDRPSHCQCQLSLDRPRFKHPYMAEHESWYTYKCCALRTDLTHSSSSSAPPRLTHPRYWCCELTRVSWSLCRSPLARPRDSILRHVHPSQ